MVVEPLSMCPSVHAFILSNTNISATSLAIAIKFYLKHYWVGGNVALGFGPGRIRTLVSMATDISVKNTIFFSETTRPRAFLFCM